MSIDREIGLRNLVDLTNVLSKHNVCHWLQSGTLLGFYRDGDFIDHDTDTDMGVLADTFTRECYRDILNKGFKLQYVYGYVADSLEIVFRRDNLNTDLFFHYTTKGNIQYHCFFHDWKRNGNYRRYENRYKPFKPKQKQYLNKTFFVPEDELLFIRTHYGDNWKTPVKKWDISTSSNNITRTNIILNKADTKRKFDKWLQK